MGQTRTLLEPEQISLDKNDDISSGALATTWQLALLFQHESSLSTKSYDHSNWYALKLINIHYN